MSKRAAFMGAINPAIEKNLSAKMINLDGSGTGVLVRIGPFCAAVSEARALRFADRIVDAVEAGVQPKAPRRSKPPRLAAPLYISRSATLTAADGTPEPDLPATPAE